MTVSGEILTEVSAVVASDRVVDLLDRFHRLLEHAMPDGLLRTELLRGDADTWRVQSLWRDRAAGWMQCGLVPGHPQPHSCSAMSEQSRRFAS